MLNVLHHIRDLDASMQYAISRYAAVHVHLRSLYLSMANGMRMGRKHMDSSRRGQQNARFIVLMSHAVGFEAN